MNLFDVIVIGGGPAGMMAAGHAAQYGGRVLLLEQNPKLGTKLNLTGGGRCNITNAEFDTRTFLSHFGQKAKYLYSPFAQFSVQDTFDFFESHGLPLKVEDRKRAFPVTDRAEDVTRVLTKVLEENNVVIQRNTPVSELWLEQGHIKGVITSGGKIQSDYVIVATGGLSYQHTGAKGLGLNWLKKIGHTVHQATPDLVPLKVKEPWVKKLSGTALNSMRITFKCTNGKILAKEGRLLFTHFGLSGPLILNSAQEVKQFLTHGPVMAMIDCYPALEIPELDQKLISHFEKNKNKLLRNTLKPMLPAGLNKAFLSLLDATLLDKKINIISREERRKLAQLIKSMPCTITGTMGYDWAIVCDGGVDVNEIDTRTMQSRLHPNLYILGDLLHISRPSGGYSLQLCWTTGFVAGTDVASR